MTGQDGVVRPAVKGDLQRLAPLEREHQLWRGNVAGYFQDHLKKPNDHIVFVAEKAGRVVGFAYALREGSNARLFYNFVYPGHLRQGIGELLTKARIGHARDVWHSQNVLVTFSDREKGVRHYAKFGFVKAAGGSDAVLRLRK